MKKAFFSLLVSGCCAGLHAQLPVFWQAVPPSSFTISGSTVRSIGSPFDYAFSLQKLCPNKDGYIEFNAEEPVSSGPVYQVGFAKASNPGTILIGFYIQKGSTGYVYPSIIDASGTATHPTYFTGTCNLMPAGTLFRLERRNNQFFFRNQTGSCDLIYSTGPITLAATEEWVVVFKGAGDGKGILNTTVNFTGCNEEIWGRTSPTTIRPLSLLDKVGIGKDPAVELDVAGTTRISTLAGTGTALTEVTANGTLQRKAMGTVAQTLAGDGSWLNIASFAPWKNAVSPAGAIYFQPAGAGAYVGINQSSPAANLDIFNSLCDNKPALKIVTDESMGCLMGTSHGDYIDFKSIQVGGGVVQRFIVQQNGAVGVNRAPSYTLDVAGNIRANTTVYTSDERFKSNIKEISKSMEMIKQLSGKEYTFRTREFPDWNFDEGRQFGFIAQELKQVMPELVKEDKDGYLGVNYVMLIPVLTEAIKEQQVQIESLKQEIAALKKGDTKPVSATADIAQTDAFLAQNVPNPFSRATEISYKLPQELREAAIGVYDLNGKEIMMFRLGKTPKGSILINAGDLKPGMYVYTLIIDGKYFDSKKMILTAQ